MQDIDTTEELRKEFMESTREFYEQADGSLVCKYKATDEQKTGKLIEVAAHKHQNLLDWIKDWRDAPNSAFLTPDQRPDTDGDHKYGYFVVDQGELVRAVDRTNPNKRWDWYVLGGRFSGFLKLKDEIAKDVKEAVKYNQRGEEIPESLLASFKDIRINNPSMLFEEHPDGGVYVDGAPKGAVDWDGMVNSHLSRVMPHYDEVQAVIGGRPWKTWEEVRDAHDGDIEGARKIFNEQPVIADLDAGPLKRHFLIDWSEYKLDREQYIAMQSLRAVSTFAMVKDGEWHEKGTMGWFGMSVNDKEQTEWSNELLGALKDLPDDTLLAVYDCHI